DLSPAAGPPGRRLERPTADSRLEMDEQIRTRLPSICRTLGEASPDESLQPRRAERLEAGERRGGPLEDGGDQTRAAGRLEGRARGRSRGTRPWRWAAASASAIWVAWRSASSSGSAPFLSRSARLSPSRCSMTRKVEPSCCPTS